MFIWRNQKWNLISNKKAIKGYNKAIEIDPQDAEAYCNRGNATSDLGNYQEAIEDYSNRSKSGCKKHLNWV